VGNHGAYKGTQQVIELLQGLDVHLVASGDPAGHVAGVRTLRLYRRDYLRLLKASALTITMSQFEEGWCRTAHEAMLCGTPVVGSGRGGMQELLVGGGQIICESFEKLPGICVELIADSSARASMGAKGQRFTRQFGLERLRNDWTSLITTGHPVRTTALRF